MSSDAGSISVKGLGKCFAIYARPHQRLMQMFVRSRKKYYKEFWALKDVSFELKKGETIGIIGRNGSGKSTLLQMICGTLNQTEGIIAVKGKVAALLELGAGFNPEFTGRENVYLCAALYGLDRKEVDQKFELIAAFAGIGDFIDQPVKIYSSGMFVRLAFAIIANVDADILIIDEALAVGDALFTQKCMRFLRAFKEEHTLLFVSHDTSSVINLCDRAIWLDEGQIRGYGPAKAVAEQYLAALFGQSEKKEPTESPLLENLRVVKAAAWRDHRQDFVNSSLHRNDMEVFRFNTTDTEEFGAGGAKILNVTLNDSLGRALSWVVGGEVVMLRVEVASLRCLLSPIVGFYVKDRLGQTLFGDNTYLNYAATPIQSRAGSVFIAEFKFPMPWLAQGDYSIAVAVADGTQAEHVHQQWVHDALLFRSHHDPLSTGIVGIPMLEIKLLTMSTVS